MYVKYLQFVNGIDFKNSLRIRLIIFNLSPLFEKHRIHFGHKITQILSGCGPKGKATGLNAAMTNGILNQAKIP
jgi:hypothetical protein